MDILMTANPVAPSVIQRLTIRFAKLRIQSLYPNYTDYRARKRLTAPTLRRSASLRMAQQVNVLRTLAMRRKAEKIGVFPSRCWSKASSERSAEPVMAKDDAILALSLLMF
jgi:hypothetical protein